MIITFIGYIAGILNTACFLPQVIKSWKTRHTKDLSLPMYLLNATGGLLWLIYGIATEQSPIFIANGVALTLVLSIVFLKIRHG